LIGHLQRECPYLPRFEVTLAYDPQGKAPAGR
jgi:hypothetical protein